MPDFQIKWLLYNINKDREEKYKLIENIIETLKVYINLDMYKQEQKAKKDKEHKTLLDETLKSEFKGKGLSDAQLVELEKFFK